MVDPRFVDHIRSSIRTRATLAFAGAALLCILGWASWRMYRARRLATAPLAAQQQAMGQIMALALQQARAGKGPPHLTPEAQRAMALALGALGGAGQNSKPVLPKDLEALLPQDIPGLRRAATQSGRQQFGQSQTAAAKADYSAPGGGTLTLAIVDADNYSGMLALAFNAGKVQREDGTGYTRKVVYRDCSGMEGYDNASRSGSVQILAAQRFLVKSSGHGIEDKALLAALDALDLDALGQLAR